MKIFLSLVALFITTSINAQISLDSCQILAKNNYPAITQYDLLELAQEYNMKSVNQNYLPQLNVTAIGGYLYGLPSIDGLDSSKGNGQFVALTQLNQLIWDGGISKRQKELLSSNTDIQKFQLDQQFQKLEQQITSLYFSILLIDEKLTTLESLKRTYQAQLQKVESAVNNGLALTSDYKELEIALLTNEQREREALLMKEQFLSMLSKFIGNDIATSETLLIPEEGQILETNSLLNPKISLLDAEISKIATEKQMLNTNLYPKLALTGIMVNFLPELGLGPANSNLIALGGISATWKIDGLWSNKSKKSSYDIRAEILESQKKQFEFQLDLELSTVKVEIERFKSRFEQSAKIASLKEEVATSYQSRYDNQNIGISDLLKTLEEVRISKSEMQTNYLMYLQAIYNYNQTIGNTY